MASSSSTALAMTTRPRISLSRRLRVGVGTSLSGFMRERKAGSGGPKAMHPANALRRCAHRARTARASSIIPRRQGAGPGGLAGGIRMQTCEGHWHLPDDGSCRRKLLARQWVQAHWPMEDGFDRREGTRPSGARWARGAGFSRFLPLAAGEGESPYSTGGPRPQYSSFLGEAMDSTRHEGSTSHKVQELESTLRSLIGVLEDSQRGMAEIGERLKDQTLRRYFLMESLRRANFRGELENILHQHGVADVRESGTAVGAVYRAWAELKAALGAGDEAMLKIAEEG